MVSLDTVTVVGNAVAAKVETLGFALIASARAASWLAEAAKPTNPAEKQDRIRTTVSIILIGF